MKSSLSVLLTLILITLLMAQSHITRQIQELEKDFRSFQYEKVIEKGNFLLADPYVTKEDSLQILKYMLNAAYTLADTVTAKNIIQKIIKCDPGFTLNPMETSPKIIEFYQHVKKQIQAHKSIIPFKPRIKTVVKPLTLPLSSSFFSLMLPGSGHLHQKFKTKGVIFLGISTMLLGSAIYATIETSQKRQDYLAAHPGANFDKLYNNYNFFYKLRNTLWVGFLIWDAFVYYDLQKNWRVRLQSQIAKDGLALKISWNW